MRILFLNQFFWPDTAATGQLLSDLAEHLAASGEDVSVLCGSANYGGTNSSPAPRVEITRLSSPAFPRRIAGRVGSWVSFLAGAMWHAMRIQSPDIVVSLTTPPLISLVGMAIQRLRGARHIIWEMDVYPDIAVDLGVMKSDSVLGIIFRWLADLPRRNADGIVALGECMQTRLLAHGIPREKIHIAENWADCDAPFPSHPSEFPFPAEGLSLIYSGNLGLAHDASTVAEGIARLDGRPGLKFTFAGGGSRHAWMRKFCEDKGLKNAEFLPYCERGELRARLAASHIGLVTQQNDTLGSIVPSKTYGILAAGRPVLFIGPRDSTPARIIDRHGCGWQIDCGDVNGLVELLRYLDEHKELVYAAGVRAHQAFVKHYQRSSGVAHLASILQDCLPELATGKARVPKSGTLYVNAAVAAKTRHHN